MKKLILIFLLLTGSLTVWSQAGYKFHDRWNVVAYGGYFANQQNINENGLYGGLYANYDFWKSLHGFSLGISGNATWLKFQQNLEKYQGQGVEVGGAITAGYFSEYLSYTHQMFTGITAGIKYNRDNGSSDKTGQYSMEQADYLFYGNLNVNFLKAWGRKENLFPRSQFILTFQVPLRSDRAALWNDKPIVSEVWSKGYYEILFKQTMISWPWSPKLNCDFKLNGLFHHERHGNFDSYGWGVNVSLHKKFKDDFIEVGFSQRFAEDFHKNIITWSIVFNLGPIIN